MTNKPSDFLDLFDLPEPTPEVQPAQVTAPDPAPVAPVSSETQATTMFDGLLDDLIAPVHEPVETSEEHEPVETSEEHEPVVEEIEEQALPDVEADSEPAELSVAEAPISTPEPEPEFVPDPVLEPEPVEAAEEEAADPENEFWPGIEEPSEALAEPDPILAQLEERGAIDPYRSQEEALDALVADAQTSSHEPKTILVYNADDKALLEERLAGTSTDVRMVVPAAPTKSRTPLLVGVGVAVLALGVIGWWTLSSNKESPAPIATPVAEAPAPAPSVFEPIEPASPVVQAPADPEPVLINPADLVSDVIQTAPVPAPVEEAMPTPAPQVAKPAPAQEPATKSKAKPSPKPEPKPAPVKSWQDDALNQLDELEKRL